jgi:hypothetical protein
MMAMHDHLSRKFAAQEARAQRVEAALRAALTDILLLNGMDFGADTAAEVMSEARSIARAALSQSADERGECDPECVHCASWRAK